jgi:hypothetical protein
MCILCGRLTCIFNAMLFVYVTLKKKKILKVQA